ncbi:unnamed protein product [Caenorhabditis brenneri]
MRFPLLRCPDLVAIEILKNMPHQELFLLSLSCKRAKKAIKMFLPKRYLSAAIEMKGYGNVVTQHGTEKRHFRIQKSCSGPSAISCFTGNTYAKIHPQNSLFLIDIYLLGYDMPAALRSFISHINVCWNSPRISIKMEEYDTSDYSSDMLRHLKLNAIAVDSVELAKDVRWEFGEHFLQCKSVKLYFIRSYNSDFKVELVNFLEMLANSPENKLEIVRILDCQLTVEEITNGLNKKGIVYEVTGTKLEMQRCDGKKILISLVDQVLEVKVI